MNDNERQYYRHFFWKLDVVLLALLVLLYVLNKLAG